MQVLPQHFAKGGRLAGPLRHALGDKLSAAEQANMGTAHERAVPSARAAAPARPDCGCAWPRADWGLACPTHLGAKSCDVGARHRPARGLSLQKGGKRTGQAWALQGERGPMPGFMLRCFALRQRAVVPTGAVCSTCEATGAGMQPFIQAAAGVGLAAISTSGSVSGLGLDAAWRTSARLRLGRAGHAPPLALCALPEQCRRARAEHWTLRLEHP